MLRSTAAKARRRATRAAWRIEDTLAVPGRGPTPPVTPGPSGANAISRLRWRLERRFAVPLLGAFLERGRRGRVAILSGLAAAAVAALAVGALVASDGGTGAPATEPEPLQASFTEPASPKLEGVTPDFHPTSAAADEPARTASVRTTGDADPKALADARRFAGAFLDYEVGVKSTPVAEALAATSTRALAKALEHRPPRLPAEGKVPRARLINVLAGPEKDGTLEVSVAIARLGAASELRLTMTKRKSRWLVSEVRG
ncbi:MAG: hypothetical protein EXQ70_02675 [Solirubrobacterales bacterium]|nr:hypothetical protein [Solirubrobacterales bacterium]